MNSIIRIGFCFAVALLVGCATPVANYAPKSTQLSFPELGVVSSAYVGDTLVTQGNYVEHDAIQVEQDVDLGLLKPYTITKGVFLKFGEQNGIGYYSISNDFEGGGTIVKSLIADPPKAVQAYQGENKLCGISVFNAAVCSTDAVYKFIKRRVSSANSFQQSLIYSGRIGNRIRLGYREFSGNSARPAFNNDVDYDLTASKVVGYKGARIEVIDATNELVRYRVISNFNTQ